MQVGPNYKRPVNTPATYRGAQAPDIDHAATARSAIRNGSRSFTSRPAGPVYGEALANYYDVRIAAQRVLEQQAQVSVTRAAQFPTLNAAEATTHFRRQDGLAGGEQQ